MMVLLVTDWRRHSRSQALSHYELRHGEAVAIGIALDTRYSVLSGLLPGGEDRRVRALLEPLGFPLWHPACEARGADGRLRLLAGLEEFREHLGGELTITLLSDIGGVSHRGYRAGRCTRRLDRRCDASDDPVLRPVRSHAAVTALHPRDLMSILDQNTERMALLRGWLKTRLAPAQIARLDDQIIRVSKSNAGPALALAIGLAPRKLGKSDLALDEAEIAAGTKLRPGLDPSGWSIDQTARILFVLASFDGDEARFAARLDKLFIGGEIGEHMALFRGLPLYPGPERLIARAAEGISSAVQPVFEAVAHANPYPHEQFSETQWNQMVLKALFIGSTLDPIQGLDERRNADLAKMLIDYAHERWAAGRPVKRRISWQAIV